MSIQFIPLGIPVSSSRAITAKFVQNTNLGGFPVTAAFAEFSTSSVGPSGSNAITKLGSVRTK